MTTRNRRNTANKKKRPPLEDKTNVAQSLFKLPSKQVAVNNQTSSKTNLLKLASKPESLSTPVLNVNLQYAPDVSISKMPNLRKAKKVVKKDEEKKNDTKNNKNYNVNSHPKFCKNVSVELNKCEELEKRLQSKNKQQDAAKQVRFDYKESDITATPKFEKALRKRKTKNYVETSLSESSQIKLNESKNIEGSAKKVPVYLQNNPNEQKRNVDDPFEFIPDSPRKKKRKGGKKEFHLPSHLRKTQIEDESSSDSDSNDYDKSMHKVLKEVREKEKKKKLIKQQVLQKNQVKNLQKQIIAARSKARAKEGNLVFTKHPNEGVGKKFTNKQIIDRLGKQIRFLSRYIWLKADKNFDIKSKRNENSDDVYFGFNEDSNEDDVATMLPPIQRTNMLRPLNNIRPINKTIARKFTSLTSTPIPMTTRRQKANLPIGLLQKDGASKNINIISNVLLSPSKATPRASTSVDSVSEIINSSLRNKGEKLLKSTNAAKLSSPLFSSPNLTSTEAKGFCGFDNSVYRSFVDNHNKPSQTPLRNITSNNRTRLSINQVPTPWRSDRLSIRRNPHLLHLKDTSLLPSYNQDMVLDSELVEKPIHQYTTTNINDSANANEIQTSILDFMNTSRISGESTPVKKTSNRTTLFDEGDFSPIKSRSANKSNENKENDGKIEERINAFGKDEALTSSPLKSSNNANVVTKNLTKKFGIENYFGFDSPDINKENKKVARFKVRRRINKNQNALPMRVPAKALKEFQDEVAEKLIGNNAELEDVGNNIVRDAEESEEDDNVPRVGLFEDPEEIKPPERVYARKRTKRVRLPSVDSEAEEEERPKRKRKDVRTPAEEAEFNKWAAQFNAMCEEVDKHDLEIV